VQVFEGDDIWECDHTELGLGWIVIPTNIGWKADGKNPMGRGLAQDAAKRYPWLPDLYGQYCQLKGAEAKVVFDMRSRMILFPTKPLDEDRPNLSWKSPASLDLIRKSAKELNDMLLPHKDADWPKAKQLQTNHVFVPVVGCGNGMLDEDEVIEILKATLDDRYTLFLERPF
jgi:hypothetical protein